MKRGANVVERRRSTIEALQEQSRVEHENARLYSKLMDDTYESTSKMINSDEFTYEEKAKASKDYIEKMTILHHEKEVERNKSEFDLETVRIGRRFLQLHDDMAEVLKKNGNYKIEVVTQDIVLNLLNK